jgi:ribosomal subunit interface protein
MPDTFESFQMSYVFRHMERSEALEEVTNHKLKHSFGHLARLPISCKVTFSIQGDQHLAQASIVTGFGPDLHCHAEAKNMYEAIDHLNAKVLQQMEKHKYEPKKTKRHFEEQPIPSSARGSVEGDSFKPVS